MRKKLIFLVLIVFVVVIYLYIGLSNMYGYVVFPKNFRLSKDKAEFSLLDSYNRRILTDIKKYKYVKPNVVVGYSETPEGYFILNLEDTNVMTLEEVGSGSLIKKFPIGLTKNEWMHELKQLNILQEPELITLSSFYNCK